MYEAYKEELLQRYQGSDKYLYLACFEKVNELNKNVQDWTAEDFDFLLYKMDSISANSIRKYTVIFREIQHFLCEKEGFFCSRLEPTKPVFEYISYPKLRSRIITVKDYQHIREELGYNFQGIEHNVRDRVMFELAWEGLSNSEIRYLKEEAIDFIADEGTKVNKIKLTLADGREIIIDDQKVVADVRSLIKEDNYVRVDKNGKILVYPYRASQYLIKPIAITAKQRHTEDESVSNLSLMLRQTLLKINQSQPYFSEDADGKKHRLDLTGLNLEDIRRSKIIYMLAINKYLSLADIAGLFGKSVECDFYWLKEVAKRIYS